jgi:hypothetical protein
VQGLCVSVQNANDALLARDKQQRGARGVVEGPGAAEKVLLRLRWVALRAGACETPRCALCTHVFVAVGLQRHNAALRLRLVDGSLRRGGVSAAQEHRRNEPPKDETRRRGRTLFTATEAKMCALLGSTWLKQTQ